MRIHRGVVNAHFVVEVGPSTATAEANIADGIATVYLLSGNYSEVCEVPESSRDPVSVLDYYGAAITTHKIGEDDDAICRANNVAVGSSEYVACRKNRDVQRGNAAAKADRAQRNLSETMINTPYKP